MTLTVTLNVDLLPYAVRTGPQLETILNDLAAKLGTALTKEAVRDWSGLKLRNVKGAEVGEMVVEGE